MPILRYPFNSYRTYRIGLTRTYSNNASTLLVNDFFGTVISGTTTPINTGGGAVSLSGSDILSVVFKKLYGNGIVSPVGALAKRISKPIYGVITSSSEVRRIALKSYGQAMITPSTNLTEDLQAGVTFGGGIITPVGIVRKMIGKSAGSGVLVASGTIVKFIGKMLYGTILATVRIPIFITRTLLVSVLNLSASSVVGDIVEEIIELPTRLNRILYSLKDSIKR